jgi:chemotaxis protein methyltransferase CheR
MIDFNLFKRLRDFLSSRFGVFIDDDKLNNIYKRKFLSIMEEFGYKEFDSFYKDIIFQRNSKLLDKIVSVITVNETYFFRENYQFEALIKYVIPELDKIRPLNESINILSAPCSTGEEVYSIAIYLLEEGHFIKKRNFLLLGIDIDKE